MVPLAPKHIPSPQPRGLRGEMESQTLRDVLGDKSNPNPGVTPALQEPRFPDTAPRPYQPGTEQPPSGTFSAGRAVLRKYPPARCYVSETEVDMNGRGEQRGHCSPRAGCSELAGPWNPTSREVDAITSKRAIRCPAGSTARRGRPGREPASPRVMGSLVSRGEAHRAT